ENRRRGRRRAREGDDRVPGGARRYGRRRARGSDRSRRGPRTGARDRRALGRGTDPRAGGAGIRAPAGDDDPAEGRSGEALLVVMILALLLAASLQAQPLHVFLRGGPKTHGPNQHEHERFVAEWVPLLASRGAEVEGALRFPTEGELARTDVLVIYAA